ncbi:MAG: periplasmic heavy metal sensor [Methyloligellaceae bacterium]
MSDAVQSNSAPEPERRRRWPRVLLVLSLALNLLFVGLVAGALWVHWNGGWGGPRHHAFAASVRRLMKELPEDRRKTTQEILSRHRAELRPLRRAAHDARHAAFEAARADPFDADRLKERLDQMQGAEASMREAMAALALELMKGLTVEERRLFLRTMMRKRFGPRGRRSADDRWHPKEGP